MLTDPWMLSALAVILLLLALISWLSGLETAVLNARRSRLATWEGNVGHAAEKLLDHAENFQSSAHLGKSLCESLLYAACALAGVNLALVARGGEVPSRMGELLERAWPGILGACVLGYFAVTLVGEALAKSLAARQPERLLVRSLGLVKFYTLAFSPILYVARRAGQLLASWAGANPFQTARAARTEEEIKLLVEGSAAEGVLEQEEKEMIHSIIELPDTVARQVMVPRIDIWTVPATATLDEVLKECMESGHSRLPVHEGTLDNVVGIVHVKDLIPHLARGNREVVVRDLLREPFFVPEGKRLDELLHEFRTHKTQLAIVVDEFGGTSGMVTVEDVLEEIVGEIADEYDVDVEPSAEIATSGEGLLVDARMPIDDLNEEQGLEIPEGDYDTLGGFVFSLFGRPPAVGERVSCGPHEFVVEGMEGLRVQRVRIVPRNEAPVEAPT